MSKILDADDILNETKSIVELMYLAVDALPEGCQDQMRTGLTLVSERLSKALDLLDAALSEKRADLKLAA